MKEPVSLSFHEVWMMDIPSSIATLEYPEGLADTTSIRISIAEVSITNEPLAPKELVSNASLLLITQRFIVSI